MTDDDLTPTLAAIFKSTTALPARSLHELSLKLSVASMSVVASLGPDHPTSRLMAALLEDANRLTEADGTEEAA